VACAGASVNVILFHEDFPWNPEAEMDKPSPRRFYFDNYALTYAGDGWALLHKDEGVVGTDTFPSALKVPYRDGKTLLQFVQDVMAQGLGESL
jgi:hypothetical protein